MRIVQIYLAQEKRKPGRPWAIPFEIVPSKLSGVTWPYIHVTDSSLLQRESTLVQSRRGARILRIYRFFV